MAIIHELSWSTSRDGTFEDCRRRYYIDYYLSWTGWNERAPAERRAAYLLKKMTRLPMLAGDLVHQAIERFYAALRQGRAISLEESQAWAVGQLREGYKTSRDGLWKARPSKLVHLAEHHYSEAGVDESTPAAAAYGGRYRDRILSCLANFYEMPELTEARSVPVDALLACEDLSTFPLFDTKVYAVPDLAYRAQDGTVQVLDWKTGAERERDRFQLAVYTEYASAKWGVDAAHVICKDVYLGEPRVVEQHFREDERASTLERIEASIQAMRAVHFDADKGPGAPKDFPRVPEDTPGAQACKTCNYRQICDR